MYNSRKNLENMEYSQQGVPKQTKTDVEREVGSKLTDFKVICELGRGSYGVVNRVLSLINNSEYVMKKINMKHVKLKDQKEALKEAQILKKVRHPNIIRYYTSFVEEDHLYIIMEYAEGGDLAMLIKSHKEKRQFFTEKQIWDFAWELCQAMDYLHNNNIIHRDIKPLNIFLSQDGHVKLGDLGVSKIVSSAASLQGTRVGTPLYLSPELVKQLPYDFKVDIWALGCVLYHLAALEPPFTGDNLISLGYHIVNKAPKALSNAYSQKLTGLIMKFLEKSPSARPKISDTWDNFPSKYRNNSKTSLPAEINVYNSQSPSTYQDAGKAYQLEDESARLKNKEKNISSLASPDKKSLVPSVYVRPATASTKPDLLKDNLVVETEKSNLMLKINTFISPVKNKSRSTSPIGDNQGVQLLMDAQNGLGNESNTKKDPNISNQDQKNAQTEKKQQDTESTVENKPKTFQGIMGNAAGNDSTLSAKQIRDNNNDKRLPKKPESDVIIEEHPTDKKSVLTTDVLKGSTQQQISSVVTVVQQANDVKEQAQPKSSSTSASNESKPTIRSRQDIIDKERFKSPPPLNSEYYPQGIKQKTPSRPVTSSESKSAIMNPLINSGSPRFVINTKISMVPSLSQHMNKPNTGIPLFLRRDEPVRSSQQKSTEEHYYEKKSQDQKDQWKRDFSDLLDISGDDKKRPQTHSAGASVRIRPVSAHLLKNMQSQLGQAAEDKIMKEANSGVNGKAVGGGQSGQGEKGKDERGNLKTGSVSIERPRSAVFAGRLGPKPVQVNREQLIGNSKSSIFEGLDKFVTGDKGFMKNVGAFGMGENEKDKKLPFFQQAGIIKEKNVLKEAGENSEDSDEEDRKYEEIFRKHKSNFMRFEFLGKGPAKTTTVDITKKAETGENWNPKEPEAVKPARPTTAVGVKKKLTILDLM